MKSINLLSKTEQKEIKLDFFLQELRRFWILLIISLGVFFFLAWLAKFELNSQVAIVDNEIGFDKEILKSSDNESLKKNITALNSQIATITQLQNQHYYWSAALIELGNLLGKDLQIDTLTLDRTTGQIDLQGTAGSRDSVLKFWSDVHKSKYIKDINFPLANLEKSNQDQFSFTLHVNPSSLQQP